ncbi:MAG: CoA-binding protein, partial [Armatimonadetes bacterium]|nr:CoA-binding protein [Armatimonadota bacterium]
MTTRAAVDRFLAERTLALVGASRGGKKFGNALLKTLVEKGYEVLPVHPEANEIDGHRCVRSLAELPDGVGGLVVAVPPAVSEKIVREAVDRGFSNIWLQQGAGSRAAIDLAEEHGINLVHGECLLMFADPRGIH